MEAVLRQQPLSRGSMPVDMAWGFPSQDSNVFLIDPFLEDVSAMLMVDDVDDATLLQQAGGTSHYQAIFSSLQDILADSATDDQLNKLAKASPSILQQVDGACNYQAIFSSLQKLIAESAPDNQLREPAGACLARDQFLSATGQFQSSFPQKSPSESASIMILDLSEMKNGRYNMCSGLKGKRHTGARNLDGVLVTDGMVSCRGTDHALAEAFKGQIGQGYGNVMSKLSAEVDHLSFEDLQQGNVYRSLYVDELSSATVAVQNHRYNKDKRKSMAPKKGIRSSQKHRSDVSVFVDVRESLISCAEAVEKGKTMRANNILQELCQVHGASAHGNGLQRMTYIFCKALAARMAGTGAHEFKAMSRDMPSSAAVLRAAKVEFEVSPTQKVVHYFANQSILKAAEGASRLHIVDYGIMNGLQWPCLLNALADRKGGPPLLVITGVEFPQPCVNMVERLAESGQRLAAYAKSQNVPFQFFGIVTDKWESLDATSLHCSEAEVLVVNCIKRLRHLPDEYTDLGSPISTRQKWLTCVHNLHPQLLVTAFVNSAHNLPFFVYRFREALSFYSNVFDMLDTLWGDIPERLVLEESYFYRWIINVIACEGVERVERPETYKQWHARITKAGFEQLPIPGMVLERSKAHVKQRYHKDFLMHDDGKGWMLLGWKGRPTLAMSAWRPSHLC